MQSGGMGEGWSDILAASFTSDPVIGEYVTNNPSTGVRTVRTTTTIRSPLASSARGV
ncbi:MAG: M36 family metallopeptidase [Bryobacterales bacterium]